MLTVQIITIAVIAIALTATYIILKYKGIAIPDISYKILSGILAVAFFLRYMWDSEVMSSTVDLVCGGLSLSSSELLVALLANWALVSVLILVMLYPIHKHSRWATLIKYYGSAVVLFNLCCLTTVTTGIVGNSAYEVWDIRAILYAVELGILVAYCTVLWLDSGYKVNKNDARWFAFIPVMILATIPVYMLWALTGSAEISLSLHEFGTGHRYTLYLAILIPIVMFLIMHKLDKNAIIMVLTYICIGTMITYSADNRFPDLTELVNWPFHLCNTAVYTIPLCLLIRSKKLFNFTLFINVLGAIVGLCLPTFAYSSNLFASEVVKFYVCHFVAFFMPLLIVSLQVFERPKLKDYIYAMVAFLIYMVVIVFVNAWGTNFDNTVDFFFVNTNYLASYVGTWLVRTRDITWVFYINDLQFVLYPLYQLIVLVVFSAASAVMWILYGQLYKLEDAVRDMTARKQAIRADRLALEVSLAGRSKEEPMNIDTADKMILQDFSKRYGASSHYAVKDANLEVCAGDIFGFLGHNGAGKSTIIKSIVGIQPITSGAISVCGYDVDKQSVMAKRCIGFVPDHYALYEKLTGREYLNYIGDLYRVCKADRDQTISYYVELFHLEGAIDNQIKTYSHGMKQKVTIMSALIHNPKLWILDEPLTGLDPDSIIQVKQCMRDHAAKGNIVFFSSHLIDVVETVCTKIAIIAKGNIVARANVADVLAEGKLEDYYRTVTEQATSTVVDDAGNLVEA